MTAIRSISLNNTAYLVFIMKQHCVFYKVGTEVLNNIQTSFRCHRVKHHTMKVHEAKEVQHHMSITSALDRGK
jgi:hypothetical protein